MKHFVLIAALLLAIPAQAQAPAQTGERVVLVKTSSQQRALTETLAGRIKSGLLGERYAFEAEDNAAKRR